MDRLEQKHPGEVELKQFHDNAIPENDMHKIACHLESCEKCRSFVEKLTDSFLVKEIKIHLANQNSISSSDTRVSELNKLLGEQNEYEVLRPCGSGGMGCVYLAIQRSTKEKVAIKTIHNAVIDQGTVLVRMRREARILSTIRHRFIVKYVRIYEFTSQKQLVFVMEFVEGETLRSLLSRQTSLPIEVSCRIAVMILEALGFLNDQGLIHRDLKPENIMITTAGIKLIDFGLVKDISAIDNLTPVNILMGTPKYMSPESFKNSGKVDIRSDFYSLGCILYEMLTGSPAFDEKDIMSMMDAHANRLPVNPCTLNRGIPSRLGKITLRLLRKNADDRYQRATDALFALSPFCQNHKGPRSNRWAVAFAITVFATFIGMVFMIMMIFRSSPGDDIKGTTPNAGTLSDQLKIGEVESGRDYYLVTAKRGQHVVFLEDVDIVNTALDLEIMTETEAQGPCIVLKQKDRVFTIWFGMWGCQSIVSKYQQGRSVSPPFVLSETFHAYPNKPYKVKIDCSATVITIYVDGHKYMLDHSYANEPIQIGFGAELGCKCTFRKIVVKDKGGQVIWPK